jgi:CheY-like chemotaxis protein
MPESLLKGRRILIVEDEYFLADELNGLLQEVGAEMLGPVACVENGLHILSGGQVPDAASLDVNLGGETVYPLADALIARAVPFVFTTGYDRAAIPPAYAHIRRLEKPVEPEMVLRELEQLLRD